MANLSYGPRLIKEVVESGSGHEVKFIPGMFGGTSMIITEIESNRVVVHQTAKDEDEMVTNLGAAWAELNDPEVLRAGN